MVSCYQGRDEISHLHCGTATGPWKVFMDQSEIDGDSHVGVASQNPVVFSLNQDRLKQL